MTDKELKKMSRGDLLEILLAQSEELDRLRGLLDEREAQLESRNITLDSSGSIAEAALKLNRVFEAADAAAKQYLESVKAGSSAQQDKLAALEKQLHEQAAALNRDRKLLTNFKARLEQHCAASQELRLLVSEVLKDLREAGIR